MAKYYATIYDFSHDMYGNPSARYQLHKREAGQPREHLHTQNRREQCGYCDSYSNAALYRLQKITGKKYKVARYEGSRSGPHPMTVSFKLA